MCLCACVNTYTCGIQKKASDPVGLEVWAAVDHLMWILGTELHLLQEEFVHVTSQPSLQSHYHPHKGLKFNLLNLRFEAHILKA